MSDVLGAEAKRCLFAILDVLPNVFSPRLRVRSDEGRGRSLMEQDYPTLRQNDLRLRKVAESLLHVARSELSDPEVQQLADPGATVLKTGRNEVPVNSDKEALLSYIRPPPFKEANQVGSASYYHWVS